MSDISVTFYSSEELKSWPESKLIPIVDFINSCFTPLHDRFHTFDVSRFPTLDEFRQDFDSNDAVLGVARDKSTTDVVAAGGYRPLEAGSDTVELKCLSTDPALSGKGIGTHMNKEVEKLAKKNGYKKIEATVIREHGKLAEFYQRLGYEKVREEVIPGSSGHPEFPNIVDITLWHMEKEL